MKAKLGPVLVGAWVGLCAFAAWTVVTGCLEAVEDYGITEIVAARDGGAE